MWLFKFRLVFAYQQKKLSIIWNVDNSYGHVLVAYSGGLHMHHHSEGKLARTGDRMINCCMPVKSTLKKIFSCRRKLLIEGPWAMNVIGIFFELYPVAQKENQNIGVTELAEFEKISLDAFFLAACSFVLLLVLLPQVTPHFLLRLLTYLVERCGQETISSRGLLTALDSMRQKIAAISLCLGTSSSRRRYTCTTCWLSLTIASACTRFTSSGGQERKCKTI